MAVKKWTSREEEELIMLRKDNPDLLVKQLAEILGEDDLKVKNKLYIPEKEELRQLTLQEKIRAEVSERQKKFDMLRVGQDILVRKQINAKKKYTPSIRMKIISNNGSQIICKTAKGIESIVRGAIISKEYLISVERVKVAI